MKSGRTKIHHIQRKNNINPITSKITLNVNRSNDSIKRQKRQTKMKDKGLTM